MHFSFSYNKKKVIQALRYHFILKPEIRIMMILVNVFAITAAILFYFHKIRPEPFFLGSFVWVLMLVSVWYVLPISIYTKSATFKDSFIINFTNQAIILETEKGIATWEWVIFYKFIESPHFFHLYFDEKSFFLIPKENMVDTVRQEIRLLLNNKISKKK